MDIRKALLNKFKIKIFFLQRMPMGFLAGMRVLKFSDNDCEVSIPYNTITKNPFKYNSSVGSRLFLYNDKSSSMNEERLLSSMGEINSDISKVKVAFYCQGPKCHRSYNAALEAVSEYGLNPEQIIWFRAGYPNLLKKFQSSAKLRRKISLIFKGSIVCQ